MKRILPICILILVFSGELGRVYGQSVQDGQVQGVVEDKAGKPIPYATVTLLKAPDSSMVKGAACDQDGQYHITGITAGKYILSASELGYGKSFSPSFNLDAGHTAIKLAGLLLPDDVRTLKGVSVTAQKPFIEHQLDKTVLNVENSIVSAGSNALEILEKAPGVSVDNNDNISLDGKAGVTIMIDGKPTYLSQPQVVNMLKTMNSSSISKIELMTQPSAKYDAAGSAGIINIITKKNKMSGWNGSITAGYGQGIFSRENAGMDLNYRNGKFNIYGNYDFSHETDYNHNYITRDFYDGADNALSAQFAQNTYNDFPSYNDNFKVGVDYFINDRQTLGVMVNGMINPGGSTTSTNTLIENPDGSLQSTAITSNSSNDHWDNYTYDLNYQDKLDTLGNELDLDAAYSNFNNLSLQQFLTNTYDSTGALEKEPGIINPDIRTGTLPSIIHINTFKADFTHPMAHNAKLEAGFKTSYVTSDNNVQYFDLDNGVWMYDSATNHFKYTENINAAYLNYSKQFSDGYSLQLGLRGEQTVSKGQQFTTDSTVSRNYFQLFPSLFLSKTLDKNNTLSFSYSRRIDRPDYQDLNPFRYYLDPYTYQEGNPFLQPQLTNSVEFSHSYKSILNTTLNYSRTTDVMTDVLNQIDSSEITYQTKDNLASLTNAGIAVSANLAVTHWWMTNNYLNVFYNLYQGEYLGAFLNYGKISWMFNSTNTFTLPAGFSAELSGFYRSAFVYGIIIGDPMYQVSGGLQKTILQKKVTIKLNVNDIFNTQHFQGYVKYQNINVTVLNHFDSRRVNLTFIYNFSKGNVRAERNHVSSIEEEQDRIKH